MRTQAILLGLGLAAGCATTSDPHAGGLLGYWATGQQGYEQRLGERRDKLDTLEKETAAEKGRTAGLAGTSEELRAQVRRQQEEMGALDDELAKIEAQCADLQQATDAQQAEKIKLQREMKAIQEQLELLRGDTDSILGAKQKKLDELQTQMRLLRERASLLTTL
jgi:chromosome segregation ATPase